jgi:hypothetical protein
MSTVLVTPYQVLSKRIRLKGWRLCAAMILLGVLLLASSYRETVLTCQRPLDQCTLTRRGWLAGPTHSFSPTDIISLSPDFCCNSDDATYQLLLRTHQGTFPLNQTRSSSNDTLIPAGNLLGHFIDDASIPQLDVHLLDLRLNILVLGIFFLVMGLFYLAAMAEVQLLVRDTLTGKLSFQSRAQFHQIVKGILPLKPSIDQKAGIEKKGRRMEGWRAWLCWVCLPSIGLLLGTILVSLASRLIIFLPPVLSAVWQVLVAAGLLGAMVIGTQAWVIQRSIGEGRRWWVYTAIGAGLAFLVSLSISGHWISSLESEGMDSSGLAIGLLLGMIQWQVLRRQLPHASWWILASALGLCASLSATPAAIKMMSVAGLYQSQPASVTRAIYDLSNGLGWLAYFAMTGAALVVLIHISHQQNTAQSDSLGTIG